MSAFDEARLAQMRAALEAAEEELDDSRTRHCDYGLAIEQRRRVLALVREALGKSHSTGLLPTEEKRKR